MAARNGRGCSRGKRSGHKVASKMTRSKTQRKARFITIKRASRHVRRRLKNRLKKAVMSSK